MSGIVAPFPLRLDVAYDEACQDAAHQLAQDIQGFHEYILHRYGGLPGVRFDEGLLAAAHRPFTSIGTQLAYSNGLEQGAVLLQSLSQGHVFVDANKRTALYACCYFLSQCGYWRHEMFLTRYEASALEELVLDLAREGEDIQAGKISKRNEVTDIAQRLDRMLAGSRNRRTTFRRLRSRGFRRIADLLEP